MMTRLKQLAAVAATALVTATAAHAAPFTLTWTGTVTSVDPSLSGFMTSGDTVTIDVIVDNGGTTAISQSWASIDTVSAVVKAGTYFGTWTDSFFPSAGFTTDASGMLTSTNWVGTSSSSTPVDVVGTGGRIFSTAIETGNGDRFGFSPFLTTGTSWTNPQPVAVDAPVPLPASVFMLLAALAGLGGLSLRRRSA